MAQWVIQHKKEKESKFSEQYLASKGYSKDISNARKFSSRSSARKLCLSFEQVIKFEPEVKTMTNVDKIEQCKKDIQALEDNLKKLQTEKKAAEEPRYYAGQHFTTKNGSEYVLARIENQAVLINVATGGTKNGLYKCTWTYNYATGKDYTTGLPTSFPSDFGPNYKALKNE